MQGLNTQIIKDLRIKLPTLVEQEKIATILSNIDDLIKKQLANKSVFQFIKQGLMQKLLTGGIRLK